MGKPMAKLKVMCARAMHEVVTALTYDITRTTGHEIALSFGTVGALQKRLDAGETADVLMVAAASIDRMARDGLVAGNTAVATTRVGVAVRDGGVLPDISTPDAFCRTLLSARAIAFSDVVVGGSAGVYLARMFVDLGFADMIKAKGLPQQTGGEVAARVAEGEAEIGMTLIAEIVAVKGVLVLGPLPPPLGTEVHYSGAVMTASAESDAAAAYIRALTHPETRPLWESAGFELPPTAVPA
jgi:molybdate transport system substrate-binding protein